MNSQIASNYFVQAEPQEQILGATGVAYGWMVKKYAVSATQEKEFDEEEEGHDFTYAADTQGVRSSEHAHHSYHSIAKRFHGDKYYEKLQEFSNKIVTQQSEDNLDKYTRSSVKKLDSDADHSVLSLKKTEQSQLVTDLNVNESQALLRHDEEPVMINMTQSRIVPQEEVEAHADFEVVNMSRSRAMPAA